MLTGHLHRDEGHCSPRCFLPCLFQATLQLYAWLFCCLNHAPLLPQDSRISVSSLFSDLHRSLSLRSPKSGHLLRDPSSWCSHPPHPVSFSLPSTNSHHLSSFSYFLSGHRGRTLVSDLRLYFSCLQQQCCTLRAQ